VKRNINGLKFKKFVGFYFKQFIYNTSQITIKITMCETKHAFILCSYVNANRWQRNLLEWHIFNTTSWKSALVSEIDLLSPLDVSRKQKRFGYNDHWPGLGN